MALRSPSLAPGGSVGRPDQLPTILIADDNVDARLALDLLLRDQGYNLAFAKNGVEALERAIALVPDLILLDVKMPGMDGFAVCRHLRANAVLAEVPIILVTAHNEPSARLQGIEAGADDFIAKCFDETELLARVRTIIRLNRYRRLLAERARFERLVELLPNGLLLIDAAGTIVLANPAALQLLGASWSHEILSQNARSFIPPEHHEHWDTAFHEVLASPRSIQRLKMSWLRRDGVLFPADVDVAQFVGDEQPLAQVVIRDVTDRVQAEMALAEERNLLRTLIDTLPDYVYVKDTTSRFLLGNQAVAQHMGMPTPEALIGKTDHTFYPPDLAARYAQNEQAIIQSGQPMINHEEITIDQAGQQRWLLTTKVPLRDRHGQTIGIMGIGRDITERKSLEAQLLQAQKMESVGRLAGGVAHDFNNLLTAILGYSDLALDMLPEDVPGREELHEIQQSAKRATNLTRQLLAFGRKQIISPQALNLNTLIVDMDRLLRRVIGEDIDLITRPAPDLGLVNADPHQLEQVLINLAVNARDAMPDGGKLSITTTNITLEDAYTRQQVDVRAGSYIALTVRDTGIGMDETVKSHIFEPFFTTKEVGRGTGLGLATCYGIVTQHGGHIQVASALGRGTSFTIYLPRAANTVEEPRPSEPAPVLPQGGETILLVEDEKAVRDLAARVLTRLGYSVLEAANGSEALRVAAHYAGAIQLLLTDVVLPELGGKQVADRLVLARPEIKVLFMSGYTDSMIVHHNRLDEGVMFLPKPFSPTALAQKVRAVLDA